MFAIPAIPFVIPVLACGAAAGIGSMLLFKRISPQDRLAHIADMDSRLRVEMQNYDGEMAGIMRLASQSLNLACQRVWCTFLPSLIAGLPVLVVMAWLGYRAGATAVDVMPYGPAWVRSWMSLYLIAVCCSAICTKLALKIR